MVGITISARLKAALALRRRFGLETRPPITMPRAEGQKTRGHTGRLAACGRITVALGPEVVTVRVVVAAVGPGVTWVGLNEQAAPSGRPAPEQLKLTVLLKALPAGDTVNVYLAGCPAFSVCVEGDAPRVKSCVTLSETG